MRFSNEIENQVKMSSLFYQGQIIGKGSAYQNFIHTYNIRIISGNNNLSNISTKEYLKNVPVIGFDPSLDPGLIEGDIVFIGFVNKDINCPYILNNGGTLNRNSDIISNSSETDNIGQTMHYVDTNEKCFDFDILKKVEFVWPDPNCDRITDVFGRRSPTRLHHGIDIGSMSGNVIVAAHSGTIKIAEFNRGGYGYMIDIVSENGIRTRYGHGSALLVKKNDKVNAGQQIMKAGGTNGTYKKDGTVNNEAFAPHLHFETGIMDTVFKQCNPRSLKYNIVPTLNKIGNTIEYWNDSMSTNFI